MSWALRDVDKIYGGSVGGAAGSNCGPDGKCATPEGKLPDVSHVLPPNSWTGTNDPVYPIKPLPNPFGSEKPEKVTEPPVAPTETRPAATPKALPLPGTPVVPVIPGGAIEESPRTPVLNLPRPDSDAALDIVSPAEDKPAPTESGPALPAPTKKKESSGWNPLRRN